MRVLLVLPAVEELVEPARDLAQPARGGLLRGEEREQHAAVAPHGAGDDAAPLRARCGALRGAGLGPHAAQQVRDLLRAPLMLGGKLLHGALVHAPFEAALGLAARLQRLAVEPVQLGKLAHHPPVRVVGRLHAAPGWGGGRHASSGGLVVKRESARRPRVRLGVKTHWRDAASMVALADRFGATALEYQMLPGDAERHEDEALQAFAPHAGRFELRVHQPERIELGGRRVLLDPASADERLRAASVDVLRASLDLARGLGATGFLVHPGGVHDPGEAEGRPERLRASLRELPRHTPLLLENMPRHYGATGRSATWAQRADDLLALADAVDGFVLDTSHAYLADPGGDAENVRDLARRLGARVRHVHACGSRAGRGRAGEGTPFADSDYGVDLVAEALRHAHPDAVVVPETMDGHQEGGRLYAQDLAALAPVVTRA